MSGFTSGAMSKAQFGHAHYQTYGKKEGRSTGTASSSAPAASSSAPAAYSSTTATQTVRPDIQAAAERWANGQATAAELKHYGDAPKTQQGFIDKWTQMAGAGKFPGEKATSPYMNQQTTPPGATTPPGTTTPPSGGTGTDTTATPGTGGSTGLPAESLPGYYDFSGAPKSKEAYDRVAGNISSPTMPTGATQTYAKGTVDPSEILTTATMGAPTTVGARTISKPTLGAAANSGTTAIGAPSAITAAGYSADTAGAAPTATGATATGLTQTVAGQAGTASTMTGATDSGAMTGALAGNVTGTLSAGSTMTAATGTTPSSALMSTQYNNLMADVDASGI